MARLQDTRQSIPAWPLTVDALFFRSSKWPCEISTDTIQEPAIPAIGISGHLPDQMFLDGVYIGAPFHAEFGPADNNPAAIDGAWKQTLIGWRNTLKTGRQLSVLIPSDFHKSRNTVNFLCRTVLCRNRFPLFCTVL